MGVCLVPCRGHGDWEVKLGTPGRSGRAVEKTHDIICRRAELKARFGPGGVEAHKAGADLPERDACFERPAVRRRVLQFPGADRRSEKRREE